MKNLLVELGRTFSGKDYDLFKVFYGPSEVYFDLGKALTIGFILGIIATLAVCMIIDTIYRRKLKKENAKARMKAEKEFKTFIIE